jgi:hypothetical protein
VGRQHLITLSTKLFFQHSLIISQKKRSRK